MRQATAPLVLCVCPRSPAAIADADRRAVLDEAEQALLAATGTIPNVHTISSASLLRHYAINDYYDSQSHQVGHIPYTPEGYLAIATALVRSIYA